MNATLDADKAVVRAAGVAELTAALVAIDTVSRRSNLDFLQAVEDRLRARGGGQWRFRRLSYQGRFGREQANLIATLPDAEGRDSGGLVLAGHADTVPYDPESRATTQAVRQGELLYGRGSCDMKGAIAAMLLAAEAVARSGAPRRRALTILITAEEEIGCLGAKRLLRDRALRADMAWVGEPTSLRPVRMHKGCLGAEVRTHGRPSHASRPELGESALLPACRAVLALERLAAELEREGLLDAPGAGEPSLWQPPAATLVVGLMQAGTARNVVPAEASFTIDVRVLPGQDISALRRRVERVVAEALGPQTRAELIWTATDPPMMTAADAEVTRLAEELTGQRAGAVSFATEGKELNALGIPSIVCGPGDIAVAHTDQEHVSISELEAAVDLYRRAIERVCL
ncbi:MAG: acetylornithine deacetylase [Planctomycetota bacterium]|nr:MAG: acetylornithine deacetylase [Planctomycetota bacterium]